MRCRCCKVTVHHTSPTSLLIEMDGWWYSSWAEFARVLGLPVDAARKRYARGACLRAPIRLRRPRQQELSLLATRFARRRVHAV